MAVPTPRPMVMDASMLVEVDRQKNRALQRLLRRVAQRGLILIHALVFKEMGKYKGKRQWARRFLRQFERQVKVHLNTPDEHTLFVSKQRAHPGLSSADVACLVVARVRGIPLATQDRLLGEAARAQGVLVLNALDTVRHLQGALRGQLPLL